MENFDFYSPTYFCFGDGAEKNTGALIRQFGGTKVLVVTGGGSIKRNGIFDAVIASLNDAELPWVELSGIQPNPLSDKVYEGLDLLRNEGCDFLLAIGGGSVIDTAKTIAFSADYDGDFWDIFAGKAPLTSSLPVGAVLTIAAAGSEGSNNSVITHLNGNLKWASPKTDLMRPKFAVMNPCFTYSLPPYQTASGAADMLAHVCERYFTNTQDVALTDRLCEALMNTILEAAPRALANPNDYAARADLMWCSTLAHNNSCGAGRAQDWSSHQIGHELSALYGCSHGASLALVMPHWMQYVMSHDVMRFARFAVNVMGCDMDFTCPERTAREGINLLHKTFESWGLPTCLADIGGKEEDIPVITAHRAKRPNSFPFGGFVKVGPEEMQDILRLCL